MVWNHINYGVNDVGFRRYWISLDAPPPKKKQAIPNTFITMEIACLKVGVCRMAARTQEN